MRIKSANPDVPSSIIPNWLNTPEDEHAAVAMVRYMRKYMKQAAIARYVGTELAPGESCQSDADILKAFRRFSLCGTHAVASCRMGSDQNAVVDARLRVRGVTGLRVVDCSVMPGLVSGNTNAATIMIAEKAADLIQASGRAGVAIPARAA